MRIKLTVSYDGTNYCGWQKQKNGISVQETVENAVFAAVGEKVSVIGSGRTDAGVHAKGQVAAFDLAANIPPEKVCKALNTVLPPDVKIIKSELAENNFHPVRSAKRKTYVYSLYKSDVILPLKERYAVMINGKLNVNLMRKAAGVLIGEHDFKSFSSTGGGVKTSVRTLYSLEIKETDDEIKFYVCGNGFLYNMVRIIVGTLVKVGEGKLTETDLKNMLAGGGRKIGGVTYPAKGLCLEKVEYE